jgi:hypothetical protein
MTLALSLSRIALAVLSAVALGFAGHDAATSATGLTDFFSHFTILSATAACVVLLASGATGSRDTRGGRGVPDMVRGAVVLYMTVSGFVFGLVDTEFHDTLMPSWADHVLHQALPLVMIADWLVDPPRRRVRYPSAASWLLLPLLHVGYSLVRGAATDGYAYPFLDPDRGVGGYGRVTVACLLLAVLFVALGALVVKAGNTAGARRRPREFRGGSHRRTGPR